jgi:hypothetical protein
MIDISVVYCVTIEGTAQGVSIPVVLSVLLQNIINEYCKKVTQTCHIL